MVFGRSARSLGFIKKLACESPWGNYFIPRAQELQPPLRVPIHILVEWSSDIHFLCPEKFALGQSRIRTRDLLICSPTSYHWTNDHNRTITSSTIVRHDADIFSVQLSVTICNCTRMKYKYYERYWVSVKFTLMLSITWMNK